MPATIAAISSHQVRVNHRGDWVFVRVRADDGLVGWGEASHSGDDAAVRAEIDALGARAGGRSYFDVEALVEPAAVVKRGKVAATAASGLEHALWDLIGKRAGQPVHRLLGGRLRDRVPLYANVNRAVVDRAPESYARAARGAIDDGFSAVKCAPFDGVRPDQLDQADTRRALELGIEVDERLVVRHAA